jgi:hypothetical protein
MRDYLSSGLGRVDTLMIDSFYPFDDLTFPEIWVKYPIVLTNEEV